MKQTKIVLLLGNITFNNFEVEELAMFKNPTSQNKALIHELNGVVECDSMEQAYDIGEDLCNMFGSYIIPTEFKGEVVYEPDAQNKLKEIFGELK